MFGSVQGREIKMTQAEYSAARERGRSLAADALRLNPEKRLELEAKYGIERCQIQYPEAYGLDQEPRIVLP